MLVPRGAVATQEPRPTGRDATRWPFAADSPWNLPLGEVRLVPIDDPRTADLRRPVAAINAEEWSIPVYRATAEDEVESVVTPAGRRRFRIPSDAEPAAPGHGDRHLLVIDPSGRFVDECWVARERDDGWRCRYHVRNRLRGPGVGDGGVRAYGGSALAGLLRTWELREGTIDHALAVALPRSSLAHGPVWPATTEDDHARYGGSVPMGTLVAIPADVDLEVLGLSPRGLAIARALQRYGGYVVDASENFTLYAEPSASPLLEGARRDVDRIRDQLRVVANPDEAHAAPTAPPFGD